MNTTTKNIIVLLFITLFFTQTSFATIYRTITNGNYNTNHTWTPYKPNMTWGFTDTVYVEHKVNFNSSFSIFGHFEVKSNGEINASNRQIIIKDNATLINNGVININKIVGDWNHNGITNNGELNINSTLTNNEGTITNNGIIHVKSHFTNSYDGIIINNGDLQIDANLSNRNEFSGNGDISVKGSLYNDWSCIFNVTGTVEVDGKFSNKGTATFGGNIEIDGEATNDWSSILIFNDTAIINSNFFNKGPLTTNSVFKTKTFKSQAVATLNGITTVDGNFKNYSNIINTGDLTVSLDYINDWGYNLTNSGTININGNTTNRGDITNNGIIIIDGNFSNKDYVEVSTGSVLYIKGNLDNSSDIDNNGNIYVDNTISGNGDMDGAGTVCHSDGLTDPTNGAKGNVYCDICGDAPNSLPIQLISFNATANNSNITISWTTANEENNDYFEVLRSVDGENFEVIAEVAGAGNSNITLDYSIIDTDVDYNTYYYKLKQTDYDSKFTISDMVVVNINAELNTKIYPNPVSQGENLNIEFESLNNNNQVSIYNINGSMIKTINTNYINETINISELAAGIYMLQIQSGSQVKMEKLIIK